MTNSVTGIEQSKKLAEILPIESADMVWVDYGYCKRILPKDDVDATTYPTITPAWSLSALLMVLPKNIGRYTKSLYWFDEAWHCGYGDEDFEGLYDVSADNPVDACVEMILELHKEGLLWQKNKNK